MPTNRDKATADFRRVMKLIIVFGIIFTMGALAYLGATGELYLHMVVAVIGGVFISVLLGCGLFAAAFIVTLLSNVYGRIANRPGATFRLREIAPGIRILARNGQQQEITAMLDTGVIDMAVEIHPFDQARFALGAGKDGRGVVRL